MFRKVNIPVLGIIENMSVYHCPQCGHTAAIFGEKGAQKLSEDCDVLLLGQLPLLLAIREQADAGIPIVIAEPNSAVAKLYREIALKITGNRACQ